MKWLTKKTPSSKEWVRWHTLDPCVKNAKALGYRSRSAFKLLELDDRWRFLKPSLRVVDLGCAPGGWCQVLQERAPSGKKGKIVGVDCLPMTLLPGVCFTQADFLDTSFVTVFSQDLLGQDVVLSDMASDTTGLKAIDHIRTLELAQGAFSFATHVLKKGGCFVAKTFQGKESGAFVHALKKSFHKVHQAKPSSSRPCSPEMYIGAFGFKGK